MLKIKDNSALSEYLRICFNPTEVDGYSELHHILPKSKYPEYSDLKEHPWNGVRLSYVDHCRAHYWIWKATGDYGMWCSVKALCHMWNDEHRRLRTITEAEVIAVAEIAQAIKGTQKVSLDTRKKLSEAGKGRVVTEETRRKISEAQIGKKISEECKAKLSAANLGKKASPEARLAQSIAQTGKKKAGWSDASKHNIKMQRRCGRVWQMPLYGQLYNIWVDNGMPGRRKLIKQCALYGIEIQENEIRKLLLLFKRIAAGTDVHYHDI